MQRAGSCERSYRFIDPEALDNEKVPEVEGTLEQCLADGLLDIIQLAESRGSDPQ